MSDVKFRIAKEPWEIEQIHELNYRTFVEEIPQHSPNKERRLVDRFHEQNTYIVCVEDHRVVGMMAVRGERPFSLDTKLPNLDAYLPKGRRTCECRLLAVEPEYRKGRIFFGLAAKMAEHCVGQGYDLAVISGAPKQAKLYQHMGFVPFGPRVGTAEAPYQPMYLSLEAFLSQVPDEMAEGCRRAGGEGDAAAGKEAEPISLLPGPVNIHPEVRRAFCDAPVSHRSTRFMADMRDTKRMLCELVGARYVELLLGSGTLANDVVATQLTLVQGRGLILSNGEFGERLVDHARRIGLTFDVLRVEWGEALAYGAVEKRLDGERGFGWIWVVHCETSTGILNDLDRLVKIGRARGLKVCADCISSVATVPADLSGVYLASCVASKGLGSFPGISMVFSDHEISPVTQGIPRYLDIGYYAGKDGVPFTSSSNLHYALRAALKRFQPEVRFRHVRALHEWLRDELRATGYAIVAPDEHASPAVLTIRLPPEVSSEKLGDWLEDRGFLLSYRSEYLIRRNWLQICLMGECSKEALGPLVSALRDARAGLSATAG